MSVTKSEDLADNYGFAVNCFLRKDVLTPAYVGVSEGIAIEESRVNSFVCAGYSKVAKAHFFIGTTKIRVSSDEHNFDKQTSKRVSSAFIVEDFVDGELRPVVVNNSIASVYDADSESFQSYPIGKRLDCGTMHRGRLFGATQYTVYWSGPKGVTDWEAGIHGCGYLVLDSARGEVLNMLEYKGKLVLVREYGLTVLNMKNPPENFSVDYTETDCGVIYKNSAQVVGNRIYFCSESGLKCFDGTKISPLEIRCAVSTAWSSAEYGGRYFLACNSDVLGRKVILCVDSADGESCIIDEGADWLYVNDGIWFVYNRELKRLEEGGSFIFKSAPIDFGTDSQKTVTKIRFSGRPIITANNGRFERRFENKRFFVRPHMRGRSFTFTVSDTKPVKGVTVSAEVNNAV